jgi:hypothetical protein
VQRSARGISVVKVFIIISVHRIAGVFKGGAMVDGSKTPKAVGGCTR